jgi:hypothetical protein
LAGLYTSVAIACRTLPCASSVLILPLGVTIVAKFCQESRSTIRTHPAEALPGLAAPLARISLDPHSLPCSFGLTRRYSEVATVAYARGQDP